MLENHSIDNLDYFFAPDRIDRPDFTIRSYQPGDGAMIAEAINSSYEHLKTYMGWARPDLPAIESERNCRRFRAQYLLNENYVLGIFAPAGDRLLGGTG